ncbi:MAG: LamG domain-containing protein, partial [Planctomycetota bacterium]
SRFSFGIDRSRQYVTYVRTADACAPAASWYHVTAVYDNRDMKIYLNAELHESGTFGGGTGSTTPDKDLAIGARSYDWTMTSYYDGVIDDMRIYDRALLPEEVEQVYQEGVPDMNEVEGDYYVDGVNGSDSYDGLTLETAFATIQKGIDEANDGNTVVVYPAVYQEEIYFDGKAITVQGIATADGAPIIEAPGDYGVSMYFGEGPESVMKHFVIRNCDLAVFLGGSTPTLSHLTIVDNLFGIGAYVGAEPNISNCIFYNNFDGDLFDCEAQYSWVQEEVNEANGPTEGLVSHWKFDEGTGATAYDSAGSYDGTIYGAARTTGQIGGALQFDGIDDYVGLPDNDPVWLPQNNFTLSVWVYFERDAGSAIEQILDLNLANSSDPSYELGYGLDRSEILGGALVFHMTTTTNTDDDLWTEEILHKNKWYHIVAVRDGTTQAIYIDGEPNVSRTCSPDPIDFAGSYDDDKVNIGKLSRIGISSAFELKGIIDDVRIYDAALSPEEIQELSETGIDEGDSPLFANAAGGDYHLKSERGRYWPEHDVWVLDDVTSPCVDGGDPNVNPSGEPMPNGGRINMGAYGGTAYASMSEWPIPEDNNRDGLVNWIDFAMLADKWLQQLGWVE